MRSTKKLVSLLLTAMLLLSFAACRDNTNNGMHEEAMQSEMAAAPSLAPEETDSTAINETVNDTTFAQHRVLVAYFSGTGHTARVEKDIAGAVEGDLFEIVPAVPYTSEDLNYNDASSRVSREHDDESLREVPLAVSRLENWSEYDTVFIGYPIWWGIAAWPVSSFVKSNDFTDKTVIPFATSASSGLGESGRLLEQASGTGDWKEGKRFTSGVSTESVQAWVNELNINR